MQPYHLPDFGATILDSDSQIPDTDPGSGPSLTRSIGTDQDDSGSFQHAYQQQHTLFAYLIPLNKIAQSALDNTLASARNPHHLSFIRSVLHEERQVRAFELNLAKLPTNPGQGWHLGSGREGMLHDGVDFKLTGIDAEAHGRHVRFAWISGKAGFFLVNVSKDQGTVRLNGVALAPFSQHSIPFENAIQIGQSTFHLQYVARTETEEQAWGLHLQEFMQQFYKDINPFVTPTPRKSDMVWGDYILHYPISRGTYGIVHAASHRVTGARVAIKQMARSPATSTGIRNEVKMLEIIQELPHHEVILKPIKIDRSWTRNEADRAYFETQLERPAGQLIVEYHIIFPLILSDLTIAMKEPRYSAEINVEIMSKLLSGLAYLHANDIAHQDIKPNNILLEQCKPQVVLYITDWGCATEDCPIKYKNQGTILYLAPEQRDEHLYDRTVDCWAAGLVGSELLGFELNTRIDTKESLDFCHSFLNKHINNGTPNEVVLAMVTKSLLSWDPEGRITAEKGYTLLKEQLENTAMQNGGMHKKTKAI